MAAIFLPMPAARAATVGAIVYVDGFNLYYGALKPRKLNGRVVSQECRWLDLETLGSRLCGNSPLLEVAYFTAKVRGSRASKQKRYLAALRTLPSVSITYGRYQEETRRCRVGPCRHAGKREYLHSVEKRTDVEIAVRMLGDAYQKKCSEMVLISGDADLVPPVRLITQEFPEIRLRVYSPNESGARKAWELTQAARKKRTSDLPQLMVINSQLPDSVPDGRGGFVEKPAGW